MTTHVYYHHPCPDGIFGALSAFLHLGPSAHYVGHSTFSEEQRSQLLASLSPSDTLFLIDFCGNNGFLKEAAQRVKRVVLLDHHKTAKELLEELEERGELPLNLEKVVDMERCGATVSWDYFRALKEPALENEAQLLETLSYIEDNDLWRLRLPNSRAFSYGLGALKLEYDYQKNPLIFSQLLSLSTAALISSGLTILAERRQQIEQIISSPFLLSLPSPSPAGPTLCLAVETDQADLRSDVGNELAKLSQARGFPGIGAVCYQVEGQEHLMKVSLRSLKGVDTTPFSQFFGGGGHASASSFMVPIERLQEMKQKPQ